MIQSKKGFEQWWLVMTIFALMTLFLLLPFISNISSSGDASDAKACSLMFSQGLTTSAFYTEKADNFNENFFDFTEQKCSSFILEATNKNQENIVKKIHSCWETLGSGKINLPNEMYGEGLCYYCGELQFEEDFNGKELQEKINNKQDTINTNFKNIKMTAGTLGVFYYQYREEGDSLDSIGSFIDSSINKYGGVLVNSVDVFNPDVNIYTGITFAEIRESKDDLNQNINTFYLNGKPLNQQLRCTTIVPLNIQS